MTGVDHLRSSNVRPLSRRSVVRGGVATASGFLAARLAGGPGEGLAAGRRRASSAALAQEPKAGGTVTLGYLDEPPTMDPRVTGSAKAQNLMINLFDTLVTLDRETAEVRPGLATAWEVSPDGTEYTFTLRSGVKFHDGTEFNADAVKYTFDSIVDPELKSLTAIGNLGPYQRSEVIDPQTIKVVFTESYAPFLNVLSGSVLAPISPTAAEELGIDGFARNPVGTGPFIFREWQSQTSMTFEKNPEYNWPVAIYHHDGPAYLDQIVVKFIPEESTLSGSLQNGETTIVDGVLPQDVARLQDDPAYQVLLPSVPGSPQILPLNASKFPTDDINVRKAILHAIDVETIAETIWFGVISAAQGPLASSTWSYNPAVESRYAYDPAVAEQMLTEAGWIKESGAWKKEGRELKLRFITTSGIAGRVGELVQGYLANVGMKVELELLEYAATAELYLAGEHNIARIGYTGSDPIALSTLYHSRNIPNTNFNRTMKPDPTLDQMLDDAASEVDRAARETMYFKIQEYIMDQALMIPLWEQTILWGASSDLMGLYPQVLGQIGFYDAWLAE